MMSGEVEVCDNCVREIPISNYGIHTAHCKRNLQLCPSCNEPIPRTQFEEHTAKFHSIVRCPSCLGKLESAKLDKHKENECPKRLVSCRYCDLEVKANEMPEHENYCGSRTQNCEGCGKLIMLKSQKLHLNSNHRLIKEDSDTEQNSNNDDDDVLIVENDDDPILIHMTKNKNCVTHSRLQHNNRRTRRISERKNRQNHSAQPNLQSDIMRLPCEFCQVPVGASEMALHLRDCRPYAAPFKTRPRQRHNFRKRRDREDPVVYQISDDDEDANVSSGSGSSRDVVVESQDSVMIPCEFCSMPFPANAINDHQPLCRDS